MRPTRCRPPRWRWCASPTPPTCRRPSAWCARCAMPRPRPPRLRPPQAFRRAAAHLAARAGPSPGACRVRRPNSRATPQPTARLPTIELATLEDIVALAKAKGARTPGDAARKQRASRVAGTRPHRIPSRSRRRPRTLASDLAPALARLDRRTLDRHARLRRRRADDCRAAPAPPSARKKTRSRRSPSCAPCWTLSRAPKSSPCASARRHAAAAV